MGPKDGFIYYDGAPHGGLWVVALVLAKGPIVAEHGSTVISARAMTGACETTALPLRAQPIDATHTLNRSAGVSYSRVFRGRSFSRRATAFSFA